MTAKARLGERDARNNINGNVQWELDTFVIVIGSFIVMALPLSLSQFIVDLEEHRNSNLPAFCNNCCATQSPLICL